jgi:hypothetical protein
MSQSMKITIQGIAIASVLCLAPYAWCEVEFERVADNDAKIADLERQLMEAKAQLSRYEAAKSELVRHADGQGGEQDRVSGVASLTFLNERNARGMVLEDQGLVSQGLLGVNFEILDNVTLITGIWTDIHSNSDGPGPNASVAGAGTPGTNLDEFYEFDWWMGASIELDKLNFTAYYEEFLNPSDDFVAMTAGFESRHIQTVISYDGLGDDLIESVKMNAYLRLLFELDGSVGPTASDGVYIELGIAPSFTLIDNPNTPVTLAVPLIVGMGADNFYEGNETVGYTSFGVKASMPIKALAQWGNWTVTTGVNAVIGRDDAVGNFNSNIAGQSNDTRVIGYVSFGAGF